jgi:hypothetical protein
MGTALARDGIFSKKVAETGAFRVHLGNGHCLSRKYSSMLTIGASGGN